MKKTIVILLMLSLLLAGCGHTHTEAPWTCGPLEHWYVCEDCGETISAPHEKDAEEYCQTCGFTIFDNGDGTYNIMGYDDWNATNSDVWVDESGTVLSEMRYECEYDEEGNVLLSKTYSDGTLINESEFDVQRGEDFFNHYLTRETIYNEDGKTITEYDPYMYPVAVSTYDPQGNLIAEEAYVYEYDDAGNVVYSASYSEGAMTYESAEMLGPDGCMYTQYIRYYSGGELVGEFSHEYEFSDDGNLLLQRDFADGILAVVGTYEPDDNGVYYLAREVCYDENGDVTDEYHYDSNGNFIEE